jgi:SAM-dependent methyltransferase
MNSNVTVSPLDELHLRIIRENVKHFLRRCAESYDRPGILLDIAPQIHEGAAPYFQQALIRTLDIDRNSDADYIADICCRNDKLIPDETFDWVVCTEVLEHTLNPFAAVTEIVRVLKPGGFVFISVPFNFRIHGPLPDCWRFTEYGLRSLLSELTVIELKEAATSGRPLMPVHYTVIAKKEQRVRAPDSTLATQGTV